MLTFDVRTNSAAVMLGLRQLREQRIPLAMMDAANATGRYIHAALRSEMQQVFDRPSPWALGGLRFKLATARVPVVSIWLEEFGGKGIAAAQFLAAEIEGGQRKHKRFEKALIGRGLMPSGMYAVPGRMAPLDQYGNVPGSFIVRMLSDLQAFGEQGYRANRAGSRRGARKTNYFFVPPPGSRLPPGVWWHLPNGLLGSVFLFVSKTAYRKRYDFYGVGQRAYTRVATRFLGEAVDRRAKGVIPNR